MYYGKYTWILCLIPRGDILLVVQKSANSPVEMVNIPIIYKVLAPSKRWLLGISSINSMIYTTENQPPENWRFGSDDFPCQTGDFHVPY